MCSKVTQRICHLCPPGVTVCTVVPVVKAMVSNHLDYCNSLLYGVSRASVAKFQIA